MADLNGTLNLTGGAASGAAFSMAIALYVILSFVGQLIADAAFGAGSTAYVAVCSVFSVLSLFVTAVFFCKKKKRNFIRTCGFSGFDAVYILPAIMLSAGMFLGFGFVNTLIGEALAGAGLNIPQTDIPLEGVFELILFSVLLALLPAVVEEGFFRGIMLSGLKNGRCVGTVFAIGAVFALYHASAVQLCYQFIYGCALTLLALKSGSAIPAAVAHFLNNFTVILLTYLDIAVDLFNPILISVGVMLAAGAIVFTVFYGRKKAVKTSEKNFCGEEKISCCAAEEQNSAAEKNPGTVAADCSAKETARFFIFSSLGIILCLVLLISGLLVKA